MSAAGVAVGTTNIKSAARASASVILSLLHPRFEPAPRERSRATAAAPRAAAHTLARDAEGATEIECDPQTVVERRADSGPLARTNHACPTRCATQKAKPPRSRAKSA